MEKNIEFRLAGFDLTQFIPTWENYTGNNRNFGIKNNINFSYNKSKRSLRCIQDLEFTHQEKTVLKIQLFTYIEFSQKSIDEVAENGKLVIPPGFLAQCASYGHGAIRGIMYLRTPNTPLEGVVLPPLNYATVFQQPLTFDVV